MVRPNVVNKGTLGSFKSCDQSSQPFWQKNAGQQFAVEDHLPVVICEDVQCSRNTADRKSVVLCV